MSRLKDLGEFGWLRATWPSLYQFPRFRSRTLIGPGDDAAVFRARSGRVLVHSMDLLVEHIHFSLKWTSPRDLGAKAVTVNVSDLAAMGAVQPLALFVGVALPRETTVDTVDKLVDGMNQAARRYGCSFLGGDTTASPGPLMISVHVVGESRPGELKKRSTARPGDWLGVTGPLGAATAGVEVLKRHKKRFSRWSAPLVKAQNRPLARLKEGRILGKNRGVHAVMDLSDGLDVSLQLMGEASRVGFEINVDQLPIVPSVRRWAGLRYRKYWDYALHGGEDYELMFTVEPRAWKALQKQLPRARIIGEVKRKAFGIQERAGSEIAPLQVKSFEHFA